jgi:hypothetical protein
MEKQWVIRDEKTKAELDTAPESEFVDEKDVYEHYRKYFVHHFTIKLEKIHGKV